MKPAAVPCEEQSCGQTYLGSVRARAAKKNRRTIVSRKKSRAAMQSLSFYLRRKTTRVTSFSILLRGHIGAARSETPRRESSTLVWNPCCCSSHGPPLPLLLVCTRPKENTISFQLGPTHEKTVSFVPWP